MITGYRHPSTVSGPTNTQSSRHRDSATVRTTVTWQKNEAGQIIGIKIDYYLEDNEEDL